MNWLVWSVFVIALLALVLAGLTVLGSRRWSASSRSTIARLEAGRVSRSPHERYEPEEIEGLPAPVQRYFRTVLTPGQAIVAAATIDHSGAFNLSATGERWRPFTSRQRVVMRNPGFLWDARIAIAPFAAVRVHDAYIRGEGLLHAAVLGLFDVADSQGRDEMARGELMRFVAEAAWYPTALLPSQGVQWEGVDDHSANATLADGVHHLTLLFRFNDAGLMESVHASARGRMLGADVSMTPWEGHWSNHQRHDGMIVPFTGEVAWVLPEGRKTYWRGTIASLNYEWSR